MTSIGVRAFKDCNGLTSITIPNSVTSIGKWAFSGCSNLTSITIPNFVTGIGEGLFEGCFGLTSIAIPNSVTSIGDAAFKDCSGLTSITIGSGVLDIGLAFTGCNNLESVTCLAEKVPSTSVDAFKDSYVEYATLQVPAQSVALYRAASPWKDFATINGSNSATIPTMDLVDGEDYTRDTDVDCDELTYIRTFNNTNWQALYVPFSMSFEDWDSQGLEVARLNGYYEYDDDKNGTIDRACLEVLMVTEGEGALKPNHPYMVRAKSTGTKTITLNNTTLYAAASNSIDCSTMETRYTFTGIYEQMSKASLNAINAYGMSGGSLKQAGGALNGFRWYMVRESREGQLLPIINEVKVHVIGWDDEEDGIETTRQDCGAEVAYNLMGQRVNDNSKGIIIKNGKKIIKNK